MTVTLSTAPRGLPVWPRIARDEGIIAALLHLRALSRSLKRYCSILVLFDSRLHLLLPSIDEKNDIHKALSFANNDGNDDDSFVRSIGPGRLVPIVSSQLDNDGNEQSDPFQSL